MFTHQKQLAFVLGSRVGSTFENESVIHYINRLKEKKNHDHINRCIKYILKSSLPVCEKNIYNSLQIRNGKVMQHCQCFTLTPTVTLPLGSFFLPREESKSEMLEG